MRDGTMASEETKAAQNEFRDVIEGLAKKVESMNFATEQELSEFVNNAMIGKSFSDISAELGLKEPKTPLEIANRIILEIPTNTTYKAMRAKAIEALEISPKCVAAHVILGNAEEATEKAATHYEAAVKLGREIHAERIAAVGESGPGLWVSHDARDFLVAMERLADAVHGPDMIERRFEIFQEIIRLNPSDNLGIRAHLLAEYFADGRLADARKLLGQFPDDTLPSMIFARPLLALVETIEKQNFQVPDLDFSDHEQFLVLRKRLPAAFRPALELLEATLRKNPSVALFSLEHYIMEVDVPEQMLIGGPFEAVEYLQEWGPIWLASGLPILLLQSYVSPKLLKLIKRKQPLRAELRDIEEQLDDAQGESWIEKLFDARPEES